MTLSFTVYGVPMGKPRMTRRDKWKQRDCVVRYRAWADHVRTVAGVREKQELLKPTRLTLRAYFPMPKSWSARTKLNAVGHPHIQKPDLDNIQKALMDALFVNDQYIYAGEQEKYWDDGKGARLEVELS